MNRPALRTVGEELSFSQMHQYTPCQEGDYHLWSLAASNSGHLVDSYFRMGKSGV